MFEVEPHLKHIILKNFKSIKSLNLEMRPINILIGANGSGKSNFISVFTFLSQLSHGKLKSYVEKNGGANSFFHFGTKNSKTISIKVDFNNNSYCAAFEHEVNDDSLVFAVEFCDYIGSYNLWSIKGKNGESGLLPGGEADSIQVRNYTREYLEKCLVYHFHDTSPTASFKTTIDLESSDYLYKDAGNIAAFLYRLKNEYPTSYGEIIASIQTVAPFFDDFYLKPRGNDGNKTILLKWLHKDQDQPFSANQLSDGTARFICMATLFLQPKELRPNTIILDEPELGLHPAALAVLAELIKSISKETQVICSTQSITFANHFQVEDFIVVDQKDGISTFKRPEKEQLKSWLEEYNMGDIWDKNLIGGRPGW